MQRAWVLTAALFLAMMGCGGGGGTGGSDDPPGEPDGGDALLGLASIQLSPADATLTIDGTTPATLDYTATGLFDDGTSRDITPLVTWRTDNPSLGPISRGTFTASDRGGYTIVRASAGGTQGSTTLTVVLTRTEPVTDGVGGGGTADPPPANAGDLFEGTPSTDDARKPRLVYPGTGALVPPNLGKLELHYRPGNGNTVFELSFTSAVTDLTLYLRCGAPIDGGCVYQPSPTVWRWLAETNRGRGPIEVAIRATDDAGSQVATGEPTTLEFSQDDLRGAVYYWSTSLESILRWDFASTTQTEAELFFDGSDPESGQGRRCVGCHALSRDGKRITVQRAGQDSGDQFLLDVASRDYLVRPRAPEPAVFTSWSPDGTQYVGVFDDGTENNGVDSGSRAGTGDDDQLLVIDGTTGERVSVIQAGGTDANPLNHPDWAASGNRIAFVSVGNDTRSLQKFHTGRVGYVEKTGDTWGAPVWLTAQGAGKNRYFPAFSPDSQVVVYDESTCPQNANTDRHCNADTDPTASLMFTEARPDATSVPGTNANKPGIEDGSNTALANSFPKWSPFEFRRNSEQGSRLMWVTFSSTRRYGLRNPPTPPNTSENDRGTLIWMAAVDPDAVARGQDPTFVPFVLPFQNITTSNHIAQWAEEAPPDVD
jgi:hypothetical protein